ncbi:hypothetical protein NC652_016695 [Populus alba x Populus x berolinensis]|nr:hypothetical protein NC652_016695 [Populus alba x Populus x berolinensis]
MPLLWIHCRPALLLKFHAFVNDTKAAGFVGFAWRRLKNEVLEIGQAHLRHRGSLKTDTSLFAKTLGPQALIP